MSHRAFVPLILPLMAYGVLSARAVDVLAKPKTRCSPPSWTALEAGCNRDGYAYFAFQVPGIDLRRGLNDNAIHSTAGPMLSVVGAQLTPDKETVLEFAFIELVDGYLCENEQWALVRTKQPSVVSQTTECSSPVKPLKAHSACPSWARPHSLVSEERVAAVTSVPIGPNTRAQALKIAQEKISVLLPMSGPFKSTTVAAKRTNAKSHPLQAMRSYGAETCASTKPAGPEDEVAVCSNQLWMRRTRDRISDLKCP